MTEALRTSGENWRPLTGVRGLAILLVLVSHLSEAGLDLYPIYLGSIGKIGVWLFFALSAFLLTNRLLAAIENDGVSVLTPYAIHRVFRIYPLLIVVLLVHVLIGHINIGDLSAHLLLRTAHDELWAISVEFKYYLVIPVLVVAFSVVGRVPTTLALVSLMACSLFAGFDNPELIFDSSNLGLWFRLVPFLLGTILAVHWTPPSATRAPLKHSNVYSLLAFLALAFVSWVYQSFCVGGVPVQYAAWISFAAGIVATGLIFISMQGIACRVFSSRVLVWLGTVSFSLYVSHRFVILAIRQTAESTIPNAYAAAFICLLLATILHYSVERPGIAVGRQLAHALGVWTGRGIRV